MMGNVRILLSEGSSLSARQTLSVLGPLGYIIDVCDPRPGMCLARFSRYARRIIPCPSFATDPAGYLQFLVGRLKTERYDVLLAVHDQAYLLSRYRDDLAPLTGLAVPPFDSMRRMQSKAGFAAVLRELVLPQPATITCRSADDVPADVDLPAYVKLAHSTAGCGVWRVADRHELDAILTRIRRGAGGQFLIQQPASGNFCVAQSAFAQGRLVAAHCYQARAQGVGGSAWARTGVSHPIVLEHLERLGRHLAWHGALMLDYFHDAAGGPAYIDANPRIGETMNATLSGVNLCEALVQVSRGETPGPRPVARGGVRTHSLMMSLLAQAQDSGSRRRLAAELCDAWSGRGEYRESDEELAPVRGDRRSLIPVAFLAAKLLLDPASAGRMVQSTVDNYALSEAAVERILKLPDDTLK